MKSFSLPDDDCSLARERLARTWEGRLYLASYLRIRLVVGVLGMSMPLALYVGDALLRPGPVSARESLSAYYHSGMRDAFVAFLSIIGFFLVTYMAGRRSWENLLSSIAGIAAVGVAWLPTTGPTGSATPVQTALGERLVGIMHFACAFTFILVLAGLSFLFAGRERERGNLWHHRVHLTCCTVMLVAVIGLVIASLGGREKVAGLSVLLLVEVLCTVAFGISWLLKGAELSRWLVHRGVYGPEAQHTAAPVPVPASDPATAAVLPFG